MRARRIVVTALLGLVFAWACPFDQTLRAFLRTRFWLPLLKTPAAFERPNVRRVDAPFAGMTADTRETPLAKLRAAYQQMSEPSEQPFDTAPYAPMVAAARADSSLTRKEREEVDLIDAKIDLRAGDATRPERLESSRKKLEAFLRWARTPEFLSEARGWLGRAHYLLGNQTAAGKLYLDELNRNGSNLSRETILTSLEMTYGRDGGPRLRRDLEQYFDTPEHAAFAIQLVTNPRLDGQPVSVAALLEKHASLLRSTTGSNALALLSMRAALREGDPDGAAVRTEPDFLWMLASAHYLSRDYAAAEAPLVALFASRRAAKDSKAAAAYGLCGVYFKTGNAVEQLRYALWLRSNARVESYVPPGPVYWAFSGWDLNLILELAPLEALVSFVERYPRDPAIRLVRYSLAVRLSRENRYGEAAEIYREIAAVRRAPRLRQLAALHEEAQGSGEGRYRLAEFLAAHSDGIYFNDALWHGLQGYALNASEDEALTAEERETLIVAERKLRDDQEERWRAYLLLREVAQEEGRSALGRKAAALAVETLGRISERFGRVEEIRKARAEMWRMSR